MEQLSFRLEYKNQGIFSTSEVWDYTNDLIRQKCWMTEHQSHFLNYYGSHALEPYRNLQARQILDEYEDQYGIIQFGFVDREKMENAFGIDQDEDYNKYRMQFRALLQEQDFDVKVFLVKPELILGYDKSEVLYLTKHRELLTVAKSYEEFLNL